MTRGTIIILITTNLLLKQLCYGQAVSIKKTWIGNKLEYLKISDTIVFFDYRYHTKEYHYSTVDNNFTLIEYYWTTSDQLRHQNDFSYKIIKLTSDTLILKPLSERARRLVNGQGYFLLIDSSKTNDQNFKFEKIFFSGTTCLGSCPGMKIEIDSSGKVFFLGEYHTGKYKGLYQGQLKPKDLEKFKKLLQNSWLDNFPTELGGAIDAPNYDFVFYFNGKRKESSGCFVPYFNRTLLNFLLDCYKIANLKKSKKPHNFEK
jgi:hypothetical protein